MLQLKTSFDVEQVARQKATCCLPQGSKAEPSVDDARSALERGFGRRRRSKPDPAHRLQASLHSKRFAPSARIGGERPSRADGGESENAVVGPVRHSLAPFTALNPLAKEEAIFRAGNARSSRAQAHRWRGQARAMLAQEKKCRSSAPERSTSAPARHQFNTKPRRESWGDGRHVVTPFVKVTGTRSGLA